MVSKSLNLRHLWAQSLRYVSLIRKSVAETVDFLAFRSPHLFPAQKIRITTIDSVRANRSTLYAENPLAFTASAAMKNHAFSQKSIGSVTVSHRPARRCTFTPPFTSYCWRPIPHDQPALDTLLAPALQKVFHVGCDLLDLASYARNSTNFGRKGQGFAAFFPCWQRRRQYNGLAYR